MRIIPVTQLIRLPFRIISFVEYHIPMLHHFPITGISVKESYNYASPATVSNNTIGSTTLANAISSAAGGSIIGISAATGAGSNVTGNTIANISKTFTGTNRQLIGIYTASDNVNNNTIFNLSNCTGATATVGSYFQFNWYFCKWNRRNNYFRQSYLRAFKY